THLVLAGVAVGAVCAAVISYLQSVGDERLTKALLYWLAGGLGSATWQHLRLAAPYVLLGTAVLIYFARDLDLMLMGEEAAAQAGVNVEATKTWVWLGASLATAATVAVAGLIGFVGLVVPHILRLALGPGHRLLLPASALGGGLLLLVADTLARTLWAPQELPVGILTGLMGGPFFLWLLRRELGRFSG
ncbi:MAG: iron chelate uptake ABC transporter family permease subunit, partial [Bacillota bacterium]